MSNTTAESDARLARWCADDDWCAFTCTAEVVGRKWHPIIVDTLLDDGLMGFTTLGEAIPPLSNTVLSESLDDLEESGVVERRVVSERPFRVEYALTDRGARTSCRRDGRVGTRSVAA